MQRIESLGRSSTALNSSQFKLLTQIGTGSFGTVFEALHIPSNTQCAIKRIDLESSDDDIEEIQKEIAILAECNDHQITRYYGCFMHEFELWIVMEYLGGGSCLGLVKALKPSTLPEPVVAEIMTQVVNGLSYLHSGGKIHRDIKAANVLLAENGDVKIADFGVAAQLSNNLSRRNTFVGTPFWMAPEVINQLDYHYSADIWSLGITAYELAHGKPPYSHLHPMKALFSIPRNDPPRLDAKFSSEFQDFVAQCLQMNPRERPTVTQLQQHPFLRRRDRQQLVNLLHQMRPAISSTSLRPSLSSSSASSASTVSNDGSRTIDTTPSPEHSSASTFNQSNSNSNSTIARAQHTSSTDSQATVYSLNNDANQDDDNDDDWDFDTIKPQPSLEQILQNPPPNAAEAPIPLPTKQKPASGFNTLDTYRDNTLAHHAASSQSLVRIFGHAARKFSDPVLEEISDLLRADPLTVGVETYLMKRIGKHAIQRFNLKPREKPVAFDDVEQILFDRWIEEVNEAHSI